MFHNSAAMGALKNTLLQAVDTAVEMHRNGDDGLPVPNYTDENEIGRASCRERV